MKFNFYKSFIALTLGLSIFCSTSCVNKKEIVYFQPKVGETEIEHQLIKQKFNAKIQSGDILGIMVNSISAEANAMFNPYASIPTMQQAAQTTAPLPAVGYLADNNGEITIPLVGKVKVTDLTTQEAADVLTEKLNKYLVEPTVNVRILNFKVSVLGEVNRPAVYTVPNERITLPEAIALAGDLSIYGQRKNIMVIRETNGERIFAHVDLTKRDVFNSPYYYLHPNDVIYIEPGTGKITSTDRTYQLAPMIISALSLLTVIITTIAK
ncbi:Polysaccharide biosynthesis/export protein [compost metagenome]